MQMCKTIKCLCRGSSPDLLPGPVPDYLPVLEHGDQEVLPAPPLLLPDCLHAPRLPCPDQHQPPPLAPLARVSDWVFEHLPLLSPHLGEAALVGAALGVPVQSLQQRSATSERQVLSGPARN